MSFLCRTKKVCKYNVETLRRRPHTYKGVYSYHLRARTRILYFFRLLISQYHTRWQSVSYRVILVIFVMLSVLIIASIGSDGRYGSSERHLGGYSKPWNGSFHAGERVVPCGGTSRKVPSDEASCAVQDGRWKKEKLLCAMKKECRSFSLQRSYII